MQVETTAIPGVLLLKPKRHGDARGFFCETYSQAAFAKAGIDVTFVQDNQSLSRDVGTVRGLHFQAPPFVQAKLVRVVRGRVFDVVVDLRKGSPTFARHASTELDSESGHQLFIPAGFAHGFCTRAADTEVLYKVGAPYDAMAERGLAWNDPDLAIAWPLDGRDAILSDKDRQQPSFAQFETPFVF